MKMGNLFGKCFGRKQTDRRIVLLLVGLDNAGKTRTANHLTGQGDRDVLPTVGFKAVNLVHRNNPVTIYDLGGGPHFREIWDQYYTDVHGVIFVVDSTDFQRVDECREVLSHVLSHERISGKPVLILANKQDLEGAMDDLELVEKLDIEALVNRCRCPTRVEAYTANAPQIKVSKRSIDPGLHKGYLWLLNYIVRRYGDLNLRVQTDMNHEKVKRQKLQTTVSKTQDEEIMTAFENPNYRMDTSNDLSEEIQEELNHRTEDGVIVVKEADRSVDYDKIENLESPKSVKLSPLFGKRNSSDTIEKEPIQLEARPNLRKLSPIVRRKFNVSVSVESPARREGRPHSSPGGKSRPDGNKRITDIRSVERLEDLRVKDEKDFTVSAGNSRFVEISLGDGVDQETVPSTKKTLLPPIRKSADRLRSPKFAESDEPQGSPRASRSDPLVALPPDPAERKTRSASRAVRTQLEAPKAPVHKRKLSLKSLRRNRTSPENGRSIFAYDPPMSKVNSARAGDTGGDFSSKTEFGRSGMRSDAVI